jgi:hypothetical protein
MLKAWDNMEAKESFKKQMMKQNKATQVGPAPAKPPGQ